MFGARTRGSLRVPRRIRTRGVARRRSGQRATGTPFRRSASLRRNVDPGEDSVGGRAGRRVNYRERAAGGGGGWGVVSSNHRSYGSRYPTYQCSRLCSEALFSLRRLYSFLVPGVECLHLLSRRQSQRISGNNLFYDAYFMNCLYNAPRKRMM